ncbi:MAG: hypothetical protein DRH37_00285 [Deltaproteobacteria bacterium]|nr:MAG: hypothetical protein DRH37_00285 [Deltaproteobacteria bacterium]
MPIHKCNSGTGEFPIGNANFFARSTRPRKSRDYAEAYIRYAAAVCVRARIGRQTGQDHSPGSLT